MHTEMYHLYDRKIYFRPGTSDEDILRETIHKTGYAFPPELHPKTILDIGGNTGIVALRMANHYKDATIYSFEPEHENFDLLTTNTQQEPRIHIHRFALGSRTGHAMLKKGVLETSRGGYTLYDIEPVPDHQQVPVMNTAEALLRLGIPQPDLIKIDTEGAEYDILTSIPEDVLSKVEWITGELHGYKDFELLRYLSKWFALSFNKSYFGRCFIFNACRLDLVDSDIWSRGPQS